MIDALFGSKTRVKLLHLFLSNPGRAFYVREITRKIDEQINSVRRELANMLSVGIIKSENSNNRLYYEVSEDYVHYAPLRQIFVAASVESKAIEEVEAVGDWQKRLKPLGDVRVGILCGKLVHGSDSDVDIILAGSINKTQAKKFVKELEADEGKSLNYVLLEYQDFYYRLSIKDRFVMSVINTKHTIIADTEQVLV